MVPLKLASSTLAVASRRPCIILCTPVSHFMSSSRKFFSQAPVCEGEQGHGAAEHVTSFTLSEGNCISDDPTHILSINTKAIPVQALPTLPSKPSFPTPHLNSEDIDNYVIPLLSRNWRISRAFVSKSHYNSSLSQRFNFEKYGNLMEFLNKLASVSKMEHHHPRIIIDKSTIELFLHTHSAYRVRNSEEKPIFHIQQPGVTLRDVRYAILVDQLFSEEFELTGSGIRHVSKAQGMLQELSLREARKRFGEHRPTPKIL